MFAAQATVPIALPVTPVELFQATDATPTLSEATPLNVIVEAVADTIVEPGVVMVSEGGVVSEDFEGELGGFGLDGGLGLVGGFGVGDVGGLVLAC